MKTKLENVKAMLVILCHTIAGVVIGVATMVAEIILVIFVAPIVAIYIVYLTDSNFTETYIDVIFKLFEVINEPFFAFVKEETES